MQLGIPEQTQVQIDTQIHSDVKNGTFKYQLPTKLGMGRTYKVVITDGEVTACHRASFISFIIGKLTFTHNGDTSEALAKYVTQRLKQQISTSISCEAGQLHLAQKNHSERAGVSLQVKGRLITSDNVTIPCIAKKINNKNELVMQLQAYCEPSATERRLSDFMPELIAVVDVQGNDLLPQLKRMASIGERRQFLAGRDRLMMVMKDVSASYQDEAPRGDLIDLKFSTKQLHYNRQERRQHGYREKNILVQSFRLFVKSLSKMPVAYSKTSGLSPRRISHIRATCRVFNQELVQLNTQELLKFKSELRQLKDAVEQSSTIALDSSLLLVPTVDENGTKHLHVKIIDFAHGLHESENIAGFESMRSEMVKSINFLIKRVDPLITGDR